MLNSVFSKKIAQNPMKTDVPRYIDTGRHGSYYNGCTVLQ
jgi:hypothetical protein